MSSNEAQDETLGFVVTSSDIPQAQPEEKEEKKQEELASSEAKPSYEEESQEHKGEKQEEKQDEQGSDSKAAAHDDGKKPNRVQKRIDKVVREREDERRKNEALQKRIAELESASSNKEPVEKDFESYEEYLDALDAYDKSGDNSKLEKEQTNENEKSNELTDSQKTALALIKEAVDSTDKPEDFDVVALDPSVAITGDMLEALAECDNPTKVMYHLGKNKDLAASIASGTVAHQMREIAKLDIAVASSPSKPVKTTSAPDPISPVRGSDAQEKTINEMSFQEYEAFMSKKESKRKNW